MKKIISGIAVAALSLVLLAVTAPAQARSADADALQIGVIGYNARGVDTWLNRNQEFVDIVNTSDKPVNVYGLRVEDSWAHRMGAEGAGRCNNFTVTELPGVEKDDEAKKLELPAGHVIRVYVGAGQPKTFGPDGRWHAVYMDHKCGYRGHFLNNLGDTVYVKLNAAEKYKRYDFRYGYTV